MSDLLSAQVSAILFGGVDDETFERVMGAIRRTEAFADLDLYRALQPSWHEALMTYDPPDPIPAGGWSRLMPHTDEAIRIFAALRAALATPPAPTEDATLDDDAVLWEAFDSAHMLRVGAITRERGRYVLWSGAQRVWTSPARVSAPITESAHSPYECTVEHRRQSAEGTHLYDDNCRLCAPITESALAEALESVGVTLGDRRKYAAILAALNDKERPR